MLCGILLREVKLMLIARTLSLAFLGFFTERDQIGRITLPPPSVRTTFKGLYLVNSNMQKAEIFTEYV